MHCDLLAICKKVRERQINKYRDVDGSCKEVTLAIAYDAARAGINTCICCGSYDGIDHHWIRHEQIIYDATSSQFGEHEEVVVINEAETSRYSEAYFIFVNADLVSLLLST